MPALPSSTLACALSRGRASTIRRVLVCTAACNPPPTTQPIQGQGPTQLLPMLWVPRCPIYTEAVAGSASPLPPSLRTFLISVMRISSLPRAESPPPNPPTRLARCGWLHLLLGATVQPASMWSIEQSMAWPIEQSVSCVGTCRVRRRCPGAATRGWGCGSLTAAGLPPSQHHDRWPHGGQDLPVLLPRRCLQWC